MIWNCTGGRSGFASPGALAQTAEVRRMVAGEHQHVADLAREQYGLELNPGPIGINTRAAHVAHKFANAKGKDDAFHLALMKAYWMEGRSIEDLEVLQDIGEKLALSRAEMAAAWEDPVFGARVDADRQQAAAAGINGVPAFIFADKYFASGAQPYEVLKQVVEKLQEEQNKDAQSNAATGN